jgi:uncharacterized protein GlcG (DUF336 family)
MNARKFFVTAAAAAVLAPFAAGGQTPSALPPYGPGVRLALAKKLVAAAEAEAARKGWQMVIAVVDSGGRLVAFVRMDNAQLASIDIAIAKAVTANAVKRPTKTLQDSVAPGSATPRMSGLPGVTPIDGGLPIEVEGKIVGAIGAAGGASSQDGEIAAAGLAAVGQ